MLLFCYGIFCFGYDVLWIYGRPNVVEVTLHNLGLAHGLAHDLKIIHIF